MKAMLSLMLFLAAAPVLADDTVTTPQPADASAALAAPAQAPAPVAAAPAPTTAKAGEEKEEKLVCRLEKVLGSNKSKRVCRTAKQRDASREAAREQMDRAQRGL